MSEKQAKVVALGSTIIDGKDLLRSVGVAPGGEGYASTIGVKMNQYQVDLHSQKRVTFFVWNIADGEQFTQMADEYLKGATGGIIFADLSEHETIMEIGDHLKTIRETYGYHFPLVIVGKVPERMRLFDRWDAKLWLVLDSGRYRVRIFFSKGDGEGMHFAFRYLAIQVLNARKLIR